MAINPVKKNIGLGEFFELAGSSISAAQKAVAPMDQPTQMVIGDAEIEVKVTMVTDARGRLSVQTISSAEARQGRIDPGMLSTLRVNFVAAVADPPASSVTGARPKRQVNDVVKAVSSRPDVISLSKLLGKFSFETTYVPNQKRWLVIARDAKGRIVRESIIPDVIEENGLA